MTKSVALRLKTYSYLMDDGNTDKKANRTKRYVIKRILEFSDHKNCLINNKAILKSRQRFKSELYDVYTEKVNKIALSSYDDKRLQNFDRLTTYPYGSKVGKKSKTELLSKYKLLILMIIQMEIK